MSEKPLSFDETYERMLDNKIPYEKLLMGMMDQSCMMVELVNYLEDLGLLEDFYDKHEGIKDRIGMLRRAIKTKGRKNNGL